MTELRRSYPYPQQLLLGGVYDLTEGAGGTIQKLPEEGAILGEREIHGKKSVFLFSLSGTGNSCTLQIGIYQPAPGLSPAGELRALNFLFDSLDQLIENELHALGQRADREGDL